MLSDSKRKDCILVVDDDENICNMLAYWLESSGYKTKLANSAEEALKVIESTHLDLILLDLVMEGESGLEVLKEVRKTKSMIEMPIIISTGIATTEKVIECFKSGANDYITKPVNIHLALARIETQLNSNRMNNLINEQRMALVASSKFASLGQMAGGIVHEIKNPLTIILGMLDIMEYGLEEEKANPEKTRKCINSMRANVDRMAKIIKSIQAYSHQGEMSEPLQVVNLKNLVSDTLVFCDERLKSNLINFELMDIDDSITVECRPVEISEVLLNLISNSVDAIAGLENPNIWLKTKVVGKKLEIIVSDSGPAIPKENRKKLFNAFYTSKEKGKGTGLGLSISSAILKHHQGSLILDENSDKTTFVITIPLRSKKFRDDGLVLVVEDDEDARSIIRSKLEVQGYVVEEASDGAEGWEIINSKNISVVVTDYKMPNLNGIELAEKIKKMKGEKPQVIFVTGFMNEIAEFKGKGYWQNVFEKPVQWDEFLGSIDMDLAN